jgi:hypothetical protein
VLLAHRKVRSIRSLALLNQAAIAPAKRRLVLGDGTFEFSTLCSRCQVYPARFAFVSALFSADYRHFRRNRQFP